MSFDLKNIIKISLILTLFFSSFSALSKSNDTIPEKKIDSLKNLLSIADGMQKIEVLEELSKALINKEPEKSTKYYREAILLSEELKIEKKEVDLLNEITLAYVYQTKYYEAIQMAKNAEQKAISLNYSTGLADAYLGVGICYDYLNSYDLALDYYLKALSISENENYYNAKVRAMNNIAIIYSKHENHESALKYFFNVINLQQSQNDSLGFANTYVNVGIVYNYLGDFQKSLDYTLDAISLFENMNSKQSLASSYENLANTYLSLNNSEQALKSYLKALNIAKETKSKYTIASVSLNLGNYYLQQNDYQTALDILNENLPNAILISEKEMIKNYYNALSQAYRETQNYVEALRNRDLYEAYKDSVISESSNNKITELRTLHDVEKKEKEIELLQAKTKIQQRQKIFLIASILVLVILAILLVYFFRLKNVSLKQQTLLLEKEKQLDKLALEKKEAEKREEEAEKLRLLEEIKTNDELNRLREEKLNDKIKHQNREIATSALQVVNKNEILNSIKETLKKYNNSKEKDSRTFFLRLIREIETSINIDADWDNFKLHFEEVHQGFFERLEKNYPNLTPNEQRLCAYLRINLDTKEIARILNISLLALEKRRYRLRKKLKISPKTNIVSFLSNL